jgi:16S rRNA G966 N2-methylase RsmD
MSYSREVLLHGEKRNAVLDLPEIYGYGIHNYGEANYVSIYGLQPAQWRARGIRLLGRTAVECTRDALGSAIAQDVAAIVPPGRQVSVVDPFAGSGNTLYWLLRYLPCARGLGFELDPQVFQLTRENLRILGLPIEISNVDYITGLARIQAVRDSVLVVFIAPPWGRALDPVRGLDLRHTEPPVTRIIDHLLMSFTHCRLLCAIQVYETLEPNSLLDLQARFLWHSLRMYTFNAPGQNHGILLGALTAL